MIPTDRPNRIGSRIHISLQVAGAGDLGELIPADYRPGVAPAIPRRERTARNVALLARECRALAVIRVYEHALARIQTLAVITRQIRAAKLLLDLLVAKKLGHR